jgi:hypothetical protein
MQNQTNWTPLVPATVSHELYSLDLDGEAFINDTYTVFRRRLSQGVVHLSIRRNDREACHDWRDFQRIKNELTGPEWEAVELYPAESRLVDSANQYHLWAVDQKLDLGFSSRLVTDGATIDGAKQRPLPDDWDQTSSDEVSRQIAEMVQAK